MPTLIGRFNELLHNLSSSNSNSSLTQQQQSRHPPTRSNSSRVPTASSNNSSNRGRPAVKRSSSHQNQQSNKPNSNRIHHGTTKYEEHRTRHRASSCVVAQCRHLSHSSTSSSSSSKPRESNSFIRQHQSRHRHHQRRHSIASVASMSNHNNNNNNPHHQNSNGKNSSSPNNNNGSMMNSSNSHRNYIRIENNNVTGNRDNSNNCVTKHAAIANSVTNNLNNSNNDDIDESLASMLVRKMKIGAITRKSHHNTYQNPTQIFHKKILKIAKKDVESDLVDGEAKGSFINRYLDGHLTKQHPDIISGKTCYDMPIKEIELLQTKVIAACTGPNGGLLNVNTSSKPFELDVDDVDFIDEDYPDSSLSSNGCDHTLPQNSAKLSTSSVTSTDTGEVITFYDVDISDKSSRKKSNDSREFIAGVDDWNRSNDFAYGISTTLYESHPSTKQKAGDPIADSYGICVRENSAIIALADGVNWGEKACLAARCAVHGCIDYLNKALYSAAESTRSRNTMDIFVALLRSFNAAHNMILSQGGHLTTLCAAVICQLKDSDRFIVCTCNVGDSLAYVYSSSHGVREITQGSHDIFSMRDMRDALGALGPVSGSEPELNNLTVAMTIVDVGDIVFLTSDGISDNFDPVVGKFAIPKKEQKNCNRNEVTNKINRKNDEICEKSNFIAPKQSKSRKIVQRSNSNPEKSSTRNLNYTSKGLPLVSAQQRHELTLLRMEDLIMNGVNGIALSYGDHSSKKTAKELCSLMVDFSTKLTMAKRRILEDPDLYSDDDYDDDVQSNEAFDKQRRRRRLVGQKLAQVPGKLDHASIAAVEVGFYGSLRIKKTYLYSNKQSVGQQPSNGSHFNSKHSLEARYNLKMKATLARFESQDSLESINEAGPI